MIDERISHEETSGTSALVAVRKDETSPFKTNFIGLYETKLLKLILKSCPGFCRSIGPLVQGHVAGGRPGLRSFQASLSCQQPCSKFCTIRWDFVGLAFLRLENHPNDDVVDAGHPFGRMVQGREPVPQTVQLIRRMWKSLRKRQILYYKLLQCSPSCRPPWSGRHGKSEVRLR